MYIVSIEPVAGRANSKPARVRHVTMSADSNKIQLHSLASIHVCVVHVNAQIHLDSTTNVCICVRLSASRVVYRVYTLYFFTNSVINQSILNNNFRCTTPRGNTTPEGYKFALLL